MADRRVIVLLVLVLVSFMGWWLKQQIAIDRCLDAGGRWNYDDGFCEGVFDFSNRENGSL